MSQVSTIEWTDASWNPTRGCDEIAPGCAHCYAKRFAERFRGVVGHAYEQGFDPRLAPDKLGEPLTWKAPKKIFVDSMSDLFHEAFDFDYIAACFGVMAAAWWHTHQVLTKRPERAAEFFAWLETQHNPDRYRHPELIEHAAVVAEKHGQMEIANRLFRAANDRVGKGLWPLPNVWIGTSIANQTDADKNVPHLLQIPAAIRFLSVEPLLGPVDLSRFLKLARFKADYDSLVANCGGEDRLPAHLRWNGKLPPSIQWLIVGGESGPGARPCNVEWIRSIVRQCAAADVALFTKQLGSRACWSAADDDAPLLARMKHKKGGSPEEWPADLRIRQFPKGAA
jgi:protein gp37